MMQTIKDFDWDAYEESISSDNTADEETRRYGIEDIVKATVTAIYKNEVWVEVNTSSGKKHSIIPSSEFLYNPDLKVGDMIDVCDLGLKQETSFWSQLFISKPAILHSFSHLKAKGILAWNKVEKAMESQEKATAYVKCKSKEGYAVDLFGVEACLPFSLIDYHHQFRGKDLTGETLEVKVVKINQEFHNIVVSHRDQGSIDDIFKDIPIGSILEGKVVETTDDGVYIDIGPCDGFIEKTQLRWRETNPHKLFRLGQKIQAVIISLDFSKDAIPMSTRVLYDYPIVEGKGYDKNRDAQHVFVVDTNVLILDPLIIDRLLHYGAVDIPTKVIEELDKMKIKLDNKGQRAAKKALSRINYYVSQNSATDERSYILSKLNLTPEQREELKRKLESDDSNDDKYFSDLLAKIREIKDEVKKKGIKFYQSGVRVCNANLRILPSDYNQYSADNYILAVAYESVKEYHANVIILTGDNGLQLKAKAMGIEAISLEQFNNYRYTYYDPEELDTGE